ncbi:MAG: ATP-binding protein [Rhodocyclaceae bacterium]
MQHPESVLLGQSQEILLLVDAQTLSIVEASAATSRQLGYTRDELIGRPITDIECALSDVFFWEEVRAGGGSDISDAEGLYQRADGSTLIARKSVHRCQGDAAGWLVVRAENVADEVQAEEELAHMASQLRATLEATADGILVLDREGRITNMNRRFAQLWHLPRELLERHDDTRLFAHILGQLEAPESCQAMRAPLMGDAEDETFDTAPLRDGRVFECKTRPAMHATQIIGRVLSVTDITEKFRAEQALIAARDAANAASHAKGEFLAMMSHEIRTPMNGIIGMAQLLQMSELPGEQREYVDTMRNSGEALLQIINDILDYSKIEARKLQLELTSFDLPALLEDLRKLFSVRLHEGGPRFSVTIDADVPARLLGDPVRLRQLLVNLIGNAFKFTEQGEIAVTIRQVTTDTEASVLRFAVRDTGIGIPADKLEHIFTPFEQADMSTTRRYGGTGLGLSICRMLSEMMNGQIGVDSQPGQGSEFWFTARLLRDTGNTQKAAVTLSTDGRFGSDTHVLIVEDNPVNLLVLTNLVRKLGGVSIQSAVDGCEALERCAAQAFDIIFMDTRMPVMDGLEATQALRCEGNPTYIVGVSADAMSEDRERALDCGMNDYVAKPVSIDALRNAIQRWSETRNAAG